MALQDAIHMEEKMKTEITAILVRNEAEYTEASMRLLQMMSPIVDRYPTRANKYASRFKIKMMTWSEKHQQRLVTNTASLTSKWSDYLDKIRAWAKEAAGYPQFNDKYEEAMTAYKDGYMTDFERMANKWHTLRMQNLRTEASKLITALQQDGYY